MIQLAHVATKKWNGICITATFILKTDFVPTSMSRLHTSFRDTMKTPTAFNSSSQIYLFVFCEQHNVTPCSINCTTFFTHSCHFNSSNDTLLTILHDISRYTNAREDVSERIKALHVDLPIWYSGDVEIRVALKIPESKSWALKRRACKRFVYAGFSKPGASSLRNLPSESCATRIIALWWEPWEPRMLAWLIHNEEMWKKKSQRDCPTRGKSRDSRECRALRSSIHLQRSVALWDHRRDRFLANAHRKTRRNSAEIGSFRCKVGWTHYSLLIPIPADFSHNRRAWRRVLS